MLKFKPKCVCGRRKKTPFSVPPFSSQALKPVRWEFSLQCGTLDTGSNQAVKQSSTGIWFIIGILALSCLHEAAPLIRVTCAHIKGKKESPWLFTHLPEGHLLLSVPFLSSVDLGHFEALPHWPEFLNLVDHRSFSPFKCLAGNALRLYGKSAKNTFFSVRIFQRGIEAANFSPFPSECACMVWGDGLRCLLIKQRQGAVSGLSVRVWLHLCCGPCWLAIFP